MGKAVIAALSVLPVVAMFFGGGVWWVRALSAAVFSAALLPPHSTIHAQVPT